MAITQEVILKVGTNEAVKTVKDLRDNINAYKNDLVALDKNSSEYAATIAKVAQSEAALKQINADVTAAIKEQAQAQVKQTKEFTAAAGSMDQMSAKLTRLRAEYRALSEAQRASADGATMVKQISELDVELKALDANIGNHQRNVGNYSSAFNGLGFSVAQLTRELPALALNANTFFLAISNNIPMMVDEINKLKIANAAANAEGKASVPIMSSVMKAVFSWNTLISVAVTLLTVFGGKIVEWVGGLIKGKDAADGAKVAQEQLNKALSEGAKNASNEVARLDILYKASQDNTRIMKERNAAIDALQKEYPKYFDNLTNEEILLGKGATAYDNLKKAIIAKANAEAFSKEIGENSIKIYDLEQERINKYVAVISRARYYIKQGHDDMLLPFEGSAKQAKDIVEGYNEITKEINALKDANIKLESNIDVSAFSMDNFSSKVENTKQKLKDFKVQLADIKVDVPKVDIPEISTDDTDFSAQNAEINNLLIERASIMSTIGLTDDELMDKEFANAQERLSIISNILTQEGLSHEMRISYMEEENDLLIASDDLKKQIEERDKKREQDKLKVMSSTFGSLSQLLGESTAEGKAMAVSKATIDTYVAAQSAFAAMSSIPPAPAWGVAAAAAAVIAGIANVKKIMEVKVPGEKGGSSSASASVAIPSLPTMPELRQPIQETRTYMSARDEDIINRTQPVLVVEDLNQVQNRVSVAENESRF